MFNAVVLCAALAILDHVRTPCDCDSRAEFAAIWAQGKGGSLSNGTLLTRVVVGFVWHCDRSLLCVC